MRRIWIAALGFAVSACTNTTPVDNSIAPANVADVMPSPTPSPTPATIRDMLAAGDGKACSQQEVRDTAIKTLRPKFRPDDSWTSADISAGESAVTYAIDTISLAGADRSISSVSCDANLTVAATGADERSFVIHYVVRPSVEDDYSFIVTTDATDASAYARSMTAAAIATAALARAANSRPIDTIGEGSSGGTQGEAPIGDGTEH